MKKIWPLLFVLFGFFAPFVFAAEQVVIENIRISSAEQNSSAVPFDGAMADNGKLIAKAGPVFTEGGDYSGMMLPYLLSHPKPISYPRWAIKQGWQGRFVIAVEILTDGSVGRYKVRESTGHRMLDRVATEAIRAWKFKPAVKDGKYIGTCIEIPVVFKLENA